MVPDSSKTEGAGGEPGDESPDGSGCAPMNVAQFVNKWSGPVFRERSDSQSHFNDLCVTFHHPAPNDGLPDGRQFLFEKATAKLKGGIGRADVWKEGCFAWEYKSSGQKLDEAHRQLLQYRESLLDPPLLVACDGRYIDIRTNFPKRATKTYVVPLRDLEDPVNISTIDRLFHRPQELEPGKEVAKITADAVKSLASLAGRMRGREIPASQVAIFLDRVVFCLFAQNVGLLGDHIFSKILEKDRTDAKRISNRMFELFHMMDRGGDYGVDSIPYFNGKLFADVIPFDLTFQEIDEIRKVSRLNWAEVDASIFGTLFEYGIDPGKSGDVGTHYTSREDIATLIEPVIVAPLRHEWTVVRGQADHALAKWHASRSPMLKTSKSDSVPVKNADRLIRDFLHRLQDVTVLDPACGSGNFLYVALQALKDLEKEVLIYAARNKLSSPFPAVGPWQLYGIEKSPFAFDLARTTIWIGWLQWTKANGYKVDWEPILSVLDGLRNGDAILDLSDPENPREPEWPEAEFIIGNPPFLGYSRLRSELGHEYVEKLFRLYGERVSNQSDLCCYWFEKARSAVQFKKSNRVGLLATQAIRGGKNRDALNAIKKTGDIFFAESDRKWILDGVSVHVSMIGFDDGSEKRIQLDGKLVIGINPNLTSNANVTSAKRLTENRGIGFVGGFKFGSFDIDNQTAIGLLCTPSMHKLPNSQVVRPWVNGLDILRRRPFSWIIDFGARISIEEARLFDAPFALALERVKPERDQMRREGRRVRWWIHGEAAGNLRAAVLGLPRFIATPRVSKHRIFIWIEPQTLIDGQLIAFARTDDYFFGVIHSRLHEVWARSQGTQVRERESGFRYTPTTCFETFPFPGPFEGLKAEISNAAHQLDEMRARWLNPPEWTREEIIEFPGSIDGPWAGMVQNPDANGIGIVRYVRRVPRDRECARNLTSRTLTNLYNKLPAWLEAAHRKLDAVVFAAYGWEPNLTDDEILAKLLKLNLERSIAPRDTEQLNEILAEDVRYRV